MQDGEMSVCIYVRPRFQQQGGKQQGEISVEGERTGG